MPLLVGDFWAMMKVMFFFVYACVCNAPYKTTRNYVVHIFYTTMEPSHSSRGAPDVLEPLTLGGQ